MKKSSMRTLMNTSSISTRIALPRCRRYSQSHSVTTTASTLSMPTTSRQSITAKTLPPLSLMPTPLLLRSYLITSILSSSRLLKLSLPLLNIIAHSPSRFLNPDKNPIIGLLVRKIIYEHFVAGDCEAAVKNTVAQMKQVGFQGVILGYAKEFAADEGDVGNEETDVRRWKEGYEKTMEMIGPEDFMAVKFSGAGAPTLSALANKQPPPPQMWTEMLSLCHAAKAKNIRVWIDAEQQDLQPTIDDWTLLLMRKFNRNNQAFMYNTFQAYLKSTPNNILKYLKLAQDEGWTMGIKLVRGAYIATEKRELIHDTIEQTHNAYNGIVENLLKRQYPGLDEKKPYPEVALMLASHNETSIKNAYAIQKSLIEQGQPTIKLEYGQLQGMADEVSCGLLQLCQQGGEKGGSEKRIEMDEKLRPRAFKCLAWGSTQECLQFLLRRVKENGDAVSRTGGWVVRFRKEIWRRVKGSFRMI
ncbi:proline dehydrogenase [Cadophora gregata]|uniref:proline dehydrogenase n=1 Tax=Cadophora gregata TaxID=51156 RepID=UPI0026DC98B5|nr:proline dehydrogenase [Cadophora gregata]KAK0101166.1 proline dehydrogenase [Cadophora gregata f. sp. sojae]KAK0115803.1 proline dehydrogenase [Cadophora gregata]